MVPQLLKLMTELASLVARVVAIERQVGNLPARLGGGGGTGASSDARIVSVPSGGRRKYTANPITYSALAGIVTTTADTSQTLELYNALESSAGTPFLVVGDEVTIQRRGSFWVCREIPRGFV